MAPVHDVANLLISSLELELRSSTPHYEVNKRADGISPLHAGSYLATRDAAPAEPQHTPGSGAFDPRTINNRGFFALFALIGAAFVLAAIWFFFIHPNGGFTFKEGDWEEYKSTVLRRKGPNGTTLSGATKTTGLGGGSIVADGSRDGGFSDLAVPEKSKKRGKKVNKPLVRGSKNGHDVDVRAYRHEKPAKVGGLNREPDGSYHHDFGYPPSEPTTSEMSQPSYTPYVPINTKRRDKRKPGKSSENITPNKNRSSSFYTHTPGSTDSHRPLRAHDYGPSSADSTPTRSRQSSPRKHHHQPSVPGSYGNYTDPLDFESRYSSVGGSETGETDNSRGTKSYFHPIPGLGAGNGSSGQRTGGNAGYGFRRGGGRGRRDSLMSDSEGDTLGS
ncbi:MAG: hypothetical protein Q9167_001202 [Letrouitia subvulpina]